MLPGLKTAEVSSIRIQSERADVPLKQPVSLARDPDGSGFTVVFGASSGRPVRARAERVRSLLEMLREASYVKALGSASRDAPGRHGLDAGQRVIVDIGLAGGRSRRLELGAVVSAGGVAARVDGGWPPVEVDRQVLDDLVSDPGRWTESRLLPCDPTAAQSLRVAFPGQPGNDFAAARESGEWVIREPALVRADQQSILRLIASLSAIESRGVVFTPAGGGEPRSMVRYEVVVAGAPKPLAVEIADAREGEDGAARQPGDPTWWRVSLAGLELVGQPLSQFRSRKLVDFDAAAMSDVLVLPGDPGPLHLVRAGSRWSFEPPSEWNWKFLGAPRTLALDPSAQSDFFQALADLDAADFETGPPFEAERTVVLRRSSGGDAGVETKLRFGREESGRRAFARLGETREGRTRSAGVAFLWKPYWELLARQVHMAAWFSLWMIEVDEVGKRKAVIEAVGTAGNEPDFVLLSGAAGANRRVPREVVNPVTDKICLLTVDAFVGHGSRERFGLDRPQYVIRWRDSGKSQGVQPDKVSGQVVTWTVGPRGPDGKHAGELDITPGLVFRIEGRDLDAFLNLLDWAGR